MSIKSFFQSIVDSVEAHFGGPTAIENAVLQQLKSAVNTIAQAAIVEAAQLVVDNAAKKAFVMDKVSIGYDAAWALIPVPGMPAALKVETGETLKPIVIGFISTDIDMMVAFMKSQLPTPVLPATTTTTSPPVSA